MSADPIRVLITGSNGLLGQKIIRGYATDPRFELIATSRGADRITGITGYRYAPMDVTKPDEILQVFETYRPDVVIHTAAMTQVDDCETDPEQCNLLNVSATGNVVDACERFGIHLIHLSTDFIFDGSAGPYNEAAGPNPLSKYGRSKLRAEEMVRAAKCPWSIVRTILLIGIVPELGRSNVILWAVNSLKQGKRIRVVNDQFRSPTLAEDLAAGCMLIAEKGATGVFNISGPETLSISQLVHRVARYWDLDESLISEISSAELSQPAPRPPRTGFVIDKAVQELGYQPHSLEQSFNILSHQMKQAE